MISRSSARGSVVAGEWTTSERKRREMAEAGGTVVANLKCDKKLIAWAKKAGLYVRIARPGPWGNPYVLGKAGDRAHCIASFRTYFLGRPDLHARLIELKGKVLGCYCHPEACHGDELIRFMRERPDLA